MAKQFSMQLSGLGPHWQASKLNIVEADVLANVGADDVYITLGDTVDLYRGVEIIETVNFLVNWMRDHNQVSSTGGAIYTSCEVSDRHATVLQTTDRVLITDGNISIGIGTDINTPAAQFSQAIDSAFTMLCEYMKDEFLKQQ